MTIETHNRGDRVRFAATFADVNGVATNPTVVQFLLKSPDGAEAVYTTASGVTNPSTGTFQFDSTLTQSGSYFWRWNGTGAVVESIEGFCKVRPSKFLDPLPG